MGRRAHGEGTIYQREDGRWAASVDLGFKGGKRNRKTYYGKTQAEVVKKLAVARAAHQKGLPLGNDRQTLGEYLDHWLKEAVTPKVRHNTLRSYRGLVDDHIKPALGRIVLTKLTPQHVQGFLNDKLKGPLSPRSVQYLHAVLRRALVLAEKWGLVTRNVAKLVDPPRVERHEVTPFDPDETRRMLAALEGDRLAPLYTVAVALGLRQGEEFGLRWSDVDLERKTLSVKVQLDRIDGEHKLVEVKTRQSRRTVAIPDFAVEVLRRHRSRQREERLAAGSLWKGNPWDLVFTSIYGTPLDGSNIHRHFNRVLEAAGLRRIRFHDLRHTAATLLLVQGVHPRVVMETLGHSQFKLTMDTYSHVLPVLQRGAAEKIDELLG